MLRAVLLPLLFVFLVPQEMPDTVTFLVDNRNNEDGYLHTVCVNRTTQLGYVQPAGITFIKVAWERLCPGGDIMINFPTRYITFPNPRIVWNQIRGVLICTRRMSGKLVFANRELQLADATYAPQHCNRLMDWSDETVLPSST